MNLIIENLIDSFSGLSNSSPKATQALNVEDQAMSNENKRELQVISGQDRKLSGESNSKNHKMLCSRHKEETRNRELRSSKSEICKTPAMSDSTNQKTEMVMMTANCNKKQLPVFAKICTKALMKVPYLHHSGAAVPIPGGPWFRAPVPSVPANAYSPSYMLNFPPLSASMMPKGKSLGQYQFDKMNHQQNAPPVYCAPYPPMMNYHPCTVVNWLQYFPCIVRVNPHSMGTMANNSFPTVNGSRMRPS
ncbi:uncharacterized protein LOC135050937 [Pseudophryne corroboree]|uniref:uncharacterized protein LOC135050937 n=1 Tax=Pseudophryne corroboree TaxID=495146 RepID=UPI003081D19D